ncbi:cytochrome c biogenesis heme-transporting ATPase CcmA [Polynucleobacter sp. UB-Tiil-W10]|uniref:cytochrome c biogenesis heme-transporting ATPase CcmA n=1 Tax=Polynucleobacter sp. UB-Tiil-W10 TaxID=1855648 RepID=UPI001C0B81AB|nr:cytochrome c biogenesis heme-transporting ATPase CcmA [Polynucleobacter sp. UB-Tiil-W10]MBU3540038.1 cytochrome c biogenesis heme-transporting ATPase CcmA [Polynucleobacter sp. UB-Tiil-W10]
MTANTFFSSSKPHLKLEAHALCCVRGERRLFQDLNLTVSAGECLHVRGENGVGKTSLLRLLTGLSKPEAGEIAWGGQSIAIDTSAYHSALLFLGHRDALKEDLTALENLQLYAALDGVELSDEKALSALWRFGLRGREYLPVNCLSAGQKRRVLMARMLTRQAKLWILDEPFNALDIHAMQALQGLISEHLEQGGLVVFTSHQEVSLPQMKVLDL